MTPDERVQAVAMEGQYTERQARFLVTVMLHAGVCVPRQYATFCGIKHGTKTQKFFNKLVRLGHIPMMDCRHNRARLYHVKRRSLYRAIGDEECRFRRRMPLSLALQRLMLLDAIVESPDLVWLSTAEEKAAHLTAITRIAPEDLPHVTIRKGGALRRPSRRHCARSTRRRTRLFDLGYARSSRLSSMVPLCCRYAGARP